MIFNDVVQSRCENHTGTIATAALPSSRNTGIQKPASTMELANG